MVMSNVLMVMSHVLMEISHVLMLITPHVSDVMDVILYGLESNTPL